jgi:hypothetical protein
MDEMDKMALTAILEVVNSLKESYPEAMANILTELDLSDEAFDHFVNRLDTKLD